MRCVTRTHNCRNSLALKRFRACVPGSPGSSQMPLSQLDTSAPRFRRRRLVKRAKSEPALCLKCQAAQGRIRPVWDDPPESDAESRLTYCLAVVYVKKPVGITE